MFEEMTLRTLLFTGLIMLIGKEGQDWSYYENDPDWWALRLYTRIN